MLLRLTVQTAIFIGIFYVSLPAAFVVLNGALGWPRWNSDVGETVGVLLVAGGSAVFFYCSGLFRRLGLGTPAPNIPPRRLVLSGLYRWSRNPMYIAYLVIAFGIFMIEGHAALLLYIGVYFIVGEVYLIKWEEPALRERFGTEYEVYRTRVPRWIGRPSNKGLQLTTDS
jgi:protein-S-isoprenylcysteine O-methyltransferase Ste14